MLITKDKKYYVDIPDELIHQNKRFELTDSLGTGGNSTVLECLDNDGNTYAVKFQLNLNEKNKLRFSQEVKLHSKLSHPHLIRYIGDGEVQGTEYYTDKQKRLIPGKGITVPYIIMEKAETNLLDYLKEHRCSEYAEYIQQFLGLSDALRELHKYAIHRDIKPENILVVGDRWVISDFGLCSFLGEDHEDLTQLHEKVGPKFWMSPEAINRIYNETIQIVPASDVFQLSSVFWFIVTSKYPLGIVSEADWDDDIEICRVLISGLAHNQAQRIINGEELHQKILNVVEEYRRKHYKL